MGRFWGNELRGNETLLLHLIVSLTLQCIQYTIFKLSSDELYLSHTQLYRVNVFSAFNPSKWAADCAAPGEQLGVRYLTQGSHLSRGQFLPEPGFEPTTLGYKSNALSIRPRLPRVSIEDWVPRQPVHFLFHCLIPILSFSLALLFLACFIFVSFRLSVRLHLFQSNLQ